MSVCTLPGQHAGYALFVSERTINSIIVTALGHSKLNPGILSEAAQVARGRLRCLGPGEILRDRLRFS